MNLQNLEYHIENDTNIQDAINTVADTDLVTDLVEQISNTASVQSAILDLVDDNLGDKEAVSITALGSSGTPNAVTLTQLKSGVILCGGDTTSADQYIELATPAAGDAGLSVVVAFTGSGANGVTISTAGAEQIAGADTHTTLDAAGDNITLLWDGSGWIITSSNIAA